MVLMAGRGGAAVGSLSGAWPIVGFQHLACRSDEPDLDLIGCNVGRESQ